MAEVQRVLRDTQAQVEALVAHRFGVSQVRVSQIVRGKGKALV